MLEVHARPFVVTNELTGPASAMSSHFEIERIPVACYEPGHRHQAGGS